MQLNQKRKRRNKRRGATAIEFAIVAPIILVFALALLEWGRFEMIRQATSTAAFNAARTGTLPGSTMTSTQEVAEDILRIYFIGGSTTTTTFDEESTTVLVSVPVAENSFILTRFFGDVVLEREFTLDVIN